MLAQGELLRLVGRADSASIKLRGSSQKMLVRQPSDDLAVFKQRGHFMRAHFEDGMAARGLLGVPSEAWIEEAGIMDAKFSHRRIERQHFRRHVRRDAHLFLRRKNVELARSQDN